MEKSPEAFRTISEVADWLGVPAHVLRFWESRFAQVKPVKRAGGRRYYRPNDMLLLGGIRKLLHDDGMTIRGVQKLIREEGVKHVAGFSHSLDFTDAIEGEAPIEIDAEPDAPDNVVLLTPDLAAEVTPEDTEAIFAASLDNDADAGDDAGEGAPDAGDTPLFASRRPETTPAPEPEPEPEPGAQIVAPEIPDDPADPDEATDLSAPPPDIMLVMNRLRDARARRAAPPEPERLAPLFERMVRLRERMRRGAE